MTSALRDTRRPRVLKYIGRAIAIRLHDDGGANTASHPWQFAHSFDSRAGGSGSVWNLKSSDHVYLGLEVETPFAIVVLGWALRLFFDLFVRLSNVDAASAADRA
jgi:hypothetical protein